MKVLEQKMENHEELFKMELDESEVEYALDEAYKDLVKEVDIDGFRKGKAPREIFERRIGKDALFDHAMKELLPDMIDDLLVKSGKQAFSSPTIKILGKEPVVFEIKVPLVPEIVVGDYESIKMKPSEVVVSDEEIYDVIEHARKQSAVWAVTDSPAEMLDVLTMDIYSTVGGIPFIIEDGVEFQLNPGWRFPAPGFAEGLVGARSGMETEMTLTLPENFSEKTLAGKEAIFKIKVNEIKREKLPEVDDDFVRKVAPDSKDLEDLKQTIRTNLLSRAEEREKEAFEDRVVDALIEKSTVLFPPILIERELDRMMQSYDERLRNQASCEEEYEHIKSSQNKEALRNSFREQAEQNVKRSLIISKIVEQGQFEVDEADIEVEISRVTANAGADLTKNVEYLNKPENRDSIRWILKTRKAAAMLTEKAKAD